MGQEHLRVLPFPPVSGLITDSTAREREMGRCGVRQRRFLSGGTLCARSWSTKCEPSFELD